MVPRSLRQMQRQRQRQIQMQTQMLRQMRMRMRTLFLGSLLVMVPGCGGGGGASFDVAVGGTSGSGVVGGTSGSGVTGGPVSGFGSVLIGGVRHLTSADDPDIETRFEGPGAGFGEADLAPGMIVQAEWRQDDADAVREASRIRYLPELSGPVTAALTTAGGGLTIEVAGLTVRLGATTVFDDVYARSNAGVTALSSAADLDPVRDRVEVSGYLLPLDTPAGASVVQASRIARIGVTRAADPEETLSGLIDDSRPGAFRLVNADGDAVAVAFDAGALADGAPLDGSGGNTLREGAQVRVTGQFAGDSLGAVTRVESTLASLAAADGTEDIAAAIEGPVVSPPDSERFRVAAQTVAFDDATTFVGGDAADLVRGRRIRVEGILGAAVDGVRVLAADTIRIDADSEVTLTDTLVDDVSGPEPGGDRTLQTRTGLTVLVRPGTLLNDRRSDASNGRLPAAALRDGDTVRVDGVFDGEGRLTALALARVDDQSCELEARVLGSAVNGGDRHYSIAGRPGLVIAQAGDTSERVADGMIGEFEALDPGDCSIRPVGEDLDGNPVDAGFVAGRAGPLDPLDD